jgi:penicillin-binding protein 2
MFLQRDDRPPVMTSQFALRVAILGGVALALFSIIFFRLWYLQVLSGDDYEAQAQNNRVREIEVPAPRGQIIDTNGTVLVDNRTALALQVQEQRLPSGGDERRAVIERLSEVAGMGPDEIEDEIRRQSRELPSSPVTLKKDVPYSLVYYLREHQAEFPGVTIERVYVREYPHGTLGAHMFGYVREVNEEQLKDSRYKALDPGDSVGQDGLESTYDHLLRGEDGATRVQVDALGRPKGEPLNEREPTAGNNLVLNVDADVQEAGEAAIEGTALPGAFVAMNVNTGAVYGMGSTPTFDPSIYTRAIIPPSLFESLTSEEQDAPLTNRALQGTYPTGSTFKLITATAALEEGLIEPSSTIHDGGSITVGGIPFRNAGGAAYGTIAIQQALQVSSDVFFYTLGLRADDAGGNLIQNWANRLGVGESTGIDLPGEFQGLVPTPEWRNELYEEAQSQNSPGGEEILVEEGETERPWSAGDNVNLSVGQGDLQVTPLQMAVGYATLANGGDVVRPHLAQRVEDPLGRVVQEINPAPRRHVDIDPGTRDVILAGLHDAAMAPGGTSYDIFGGFPVEIAGKTGTAETSTGYDQSWYVALAPADDPEVVVAVTIERGGFGAEAAAPAASQILEEYLEIKPGKVETPAPGEVTGAYE